MAEITSELLDNFPFERFASSGVIQRGRQYFRQGKVSLIEFDTISAYLFSEGSYGEEYDVDIFFSGNQLHAACTCPHAQQVQVCKHIVASILTLSEHLKNAKKGSKSKWERRLSNALENLPKKKGTRKVKPYLAL